MKFLKKLAKKTDWKKVGKVSMVVGLGCTLLGTLSDNFTKEEIIRDEVRKQLQSKNE